MRPCAGLFFATLAVLLAFVPAASAAEPRIAAGVSAAGTDVSGLTLAEAAGKLYDAHGFTVGKPLSTHVAGRKFAVNPSDLGLRLRRQQVRPARLQRRHRAAHRPGRRPALHDLRREEGHGLRGQGRERRSSSDPRDARVDIKLSKIGKVASKDGRTIDATALATAVGAALGDPKARPHPRAAS